MKLYEIDVGNEEGWSYFLPEGANTQYFTFCQYCNWPIEYTTREKVLRWQGGADPGDFASGVIGDYVKRHVAQELVTQFTDLIVREVSIVNRGSAGNAKQRSLYHGEDLVEISSDHRIQLDSARCTLSGERRYCPCPVCGRTLGELDGIELRPEYYGSSNVSKPNLLKRLPRQPGKGVFLYDDELNDRHFFYLGGSLRLCCTEVVRNFVLERQYSHADLIEIGETINREERIPIRF